ncbi:MAG: diguanylate cyclase [Thermoanaerobaculia bacterium]
MLDWAQFRNLEEPATVRMPIRTKLFLSHFLAVLLVSGSIGTYFYKQSTASLLESLQNRLRYSAGLLARTLDGTDLAAIRGLEDAARPEYTRLLAQMRDFQQANPDIAFIYVMRREGGSENSGEGEVRFVLDSDSSADQAKPGDPYEEEVPRMREGFLHLAADDAITQDRWGYFLSGYAPVKNGEGRLLVGLDMRADEVQRKFRRIRLAGAISLLLSVLLAAAFSRLLASRITRPVTRLIARTGEIARGELSGEVRVDSGDELEELAGAFNRMARELLESQTRREQAMHALADANLHLEARIAERTAKLSELNTALLAEIEERKSAELRLERAATTDFLTDLLNRPAMLRLLDQETERVLRTTEPYALALADLDYFKPINDRFGHAVGDQALRRVADLMRSSLRRQDAICRWGGDELLIFLPETNLAGAVEAAEKVRQRLGEVPLIVKGEELRLSLSIGVAEANRDEPVTEVIRRADEALYRAKQDGRDRVARSA